MRRGAVQGTKERDSWRPRKEREGGNDWRGGRRLRRRGERETEAALKSWAGCQNPASVPPGLVLIRTERDASGPSALQLPVILTITLVSRPIFPQPRGGRVADFVENANRCVHSAAFVWQREFYRSAAHCNRSSPKFASRRSEHRMLLFINRLRPEALGSGVVVLPARCRAKAVVTWRSKGGSRSGVTRLSSFLTDHPR